MLKDILTGNTQTHLVSLNDKDNSPLIHKDMKESYIKLHKRCLEEGIKLKIVSSFRDFNRQLSIWNNKARGLRPLLDANENELNFNELSEIEIIHAILRWSALPGCSRHHWGTDIDVIDQAAMPENYKVQLVPSEYSHKGVFNKLNKLLTKLIEEDNAYGFYRPYKTERNGVSPEAWHLSYAPLSQDYKTNFNYEFFINFLDQQNENDFALLNVIKENSKEIFERYIINTD